jgi:polysaccharide biosynthesis protein PslH
VRILFLSPRRSWPAISGAKLREYFLCRALARSGSVTLAYFEPPGDSTAPPGDLGRFRRVQGVPQPESYTPAQLVQGLFGRWPLPVVNYTSEAMKSAIARILKEDAFDLIHIESIQMAAYVPLIQRDQQIPVVYDWHNIESELMRRYSTQAASPGRKLYAAITARRLAVLERSILHTGFGHIVCSERERDQLLRLAPLSRIAVIENGVDTAGFRECAQGNPHRTRIVFVGSMDYHANVEAAVAFVSAVWPRIHAQFPERTLSLVGSNPSPAVVALRNAGGVEVTGTVPDVRPYYRSALAAIVPLRTGGGTRLKILEAMAAGVPVVSTSLGAEGLAVSRGENILIADSDDEWLPHLSELSGHPELVSRLTSSATNLVESRYDWTVLGESLCSTYRRWLA